MKRITICLFLILTTICFAQKISLDELGNNTSERIITLHQGSPLVEMYVNRDVINGDTVFIITFDLTSLMATTGLQHRETPCFVLGKNIEEAVECVDSWINVLGSKKKASVKMNDKYYFDFIGKSWFRICVIGSKEISVAIREGSLLAVSRELQEYGKTKQFAELI